MNIIKRVIFLLLCVGLITATSACISTYQPMPYGVWQSDDPNIVLIIDPNYAELEKPPWSIVYPGIYVKDGEEIDIIAVVDNTRGRGGILIFDASLDRFDDFSSAFFVGEYRVRGERLHYTFNQHWREATGVDEIIFVKSD